MTGPSHGAATDRVWPKSPAEARRLQARLRDSVIRKDDVAPVRAVAGLDAHYAKRSGLVWGAAAAFDWPGLELRESALAGRPLDFPYVPGLLSFREAPALLAALESLTVRPDLLLVDGQGLAHPRRFGLACHVGVLADLPTIGVAKSRLIGSHAEPGAGKGSRSPLMDGDEVIGAVVRTRDATRPLFVSVGHRIGLESAVERVLRCTPRFRLPEPLRIADRLSRLHPP